jgi:hypothetical protein
MDLLKTKITPGLQEAYDTASDSSFRRARNLLKTQVES